MICQHRFAIAALVLGLVTLSMIAFSQAPFSDPGILSVRYATLVVPDYDQALRWYTDVLGLQKVEDGAFGDGKRWLVVAPRGQKNFGIILETAKPLSPDDPIHDYQDRVGKETRWVFEVADCHKFYEQASKRGVRFLEPPADQPWGTQAFFEDLYGNIFVAESRRPKLGNPAP